MKKNFKRLFILLVYFVTGIGLAAPRHAVVQSVHDHETYREYIGATGKLSQRNAGYRMVVPKAAWNGTLLIYARGTGSAILFDPATGEPIYDDVSGIPKVDVTPLTNLPGGNADTFAPEARLLMDSTLHFVALARCDRMRRKANPDFLQRIDSGDAHGLYLAIRTNPGNSHPLKVVVKGLGFHSKELLDMVALREKNRHCQSWRPLRQIDFLHGENAGRGRI